MHRGQRALDLANKLISDFKAAHWSRGYAPLDSYRTICERCGVSSKTVANALRSVAQRGFLIRINSLHVYLVDPKRYPDTRALSAALGRREPYVRRLEEMVCEGHFKAGTQLPKISYFAEMFGVSSKRITYTLRALEKKGMVRKHGKKWLVGLPAAMVQNQLLYITSSYQQAQPEVLVVCRDLHHYHNICTRHLYKSCIDTLYQRLLFEGIIYKVAYTHSLPSTFNGISGIDNIEKYVKERKDRIRGIFIAGYVADIYDARFFARFCRFNKPVVVFNPSYIPSNPLAADLAQNPHLSVLTEDQKTAVHLVLEHLHTLGHRKIGVPIPPAFYEQPWHRIWMDYRLKLLRTCVRSRFPDMTLYTAKKSCSLEHAHRINPSAQNGTETALGGVELPIKMKDSYIADFIPSLQYLLQRKGVSAIVALSDDGARHYSVWCAASGMHIPRDFTLVSFDNSRYAEALHFTSVDFRLDFAGHKAADLFVNPGRALIRSTKTIVSQPLLVVRESCAYVEGMG